MAFIHPPLSPSTHPPSPIHPPVRPCTQPFIRLLFVIRPSIDSSIYPFTQELSHSSIHTFIHPFACPSISPRTHSSPRLLNHVPIHPRTQPPTRPPAMHSVTRHPLTHPSPIHPSITHASIRLSEYPLGLSVYRHQGGGMHRTGVWVTGRQWQRDRPSCQTGTCSGMGPLR